MWLRDLTNINQSLNTSFNEVLVTNKKGLKEMALQFDNILGDLTDYSHLLSSIYFIPLTQVTTDNVEGYLMAPTVVGTYVVPARNVEGCNIQNLGEFYVAPKYNNFADYKGYTYIKVYLPFLGFVDVDINECMGKYLQFICLINYHRGTCTYVIGVTQNSVNYTLPIITKNVIDNNYEHCRVISTFECEIGNQIPIGKNNLGDITRNGILGAVKIATGVISAIATKSAPLPTMTETTEMEYDVSARGTEKGSRMKPVVHATETSTTTRTYSTPKSTTKMVSECVDAGLDALNRYVPQSSTDRINSSSEMFGLSEDVIVCMYRPKIMNTTEDYNFLVGKPVGAPYKLSEVSGYTEISNIHLEHSDFSKATEEEMLELESIILSSNGIILPGNKRELLNLTIEGSENKFEANYNFVPNMDWQEFISSPYNVNNHFDIEKNLFPPEIVTDEYKVYYNRRAIKDFSDSFVYNNNLVMTAPYTV